MTKCRARASVSLCQRYHPVCKRADSIGMAHPNLLQGRSAMKQGVAGRRCQLRKSIFTVVPGNLAAKQLREQLMAVADAEDRQVELHDALVNRHGIWVIDALRSSGQDDTRVVRQDLSFCGWWKYLGIDRKIA